MNTPSLIFSINPGSTSTKCSFFRADGPTVTPVCEEFVEHPASELFAFNTIREQLEYRDAWIRDVVDRRQPDGEPIAACVALGGMLPPVPAGVIRVTPELVDFSLHTPVYEHASNLGAPLAWEAARRCGAEAFIADPVSVDEFSTVARLSGSPDFPRFSFVHALNIRATARKLAARLGCSFEELRCVAAHLGGGFSIAALDRGRLVDNDNRMESAPFTPERAGGVPPIPLVHACFSGRHTREEILEKLYGRGGVFGYLGTKDMRLVAQQARAEPTSRARLVYEAMIYQIGKEIGAMSAVLDFQLHGIILTGGLAHEPFLVEELTRKTQRLAPVFLFPGSHENEALAESAARVLAGREQALNWPLHENPADKDHARETERVPT